MRDEAYYERVRHTADIAIRVWGRDMRALFANAARALFDMMAEVPAGETLARDVTIESVDREGLLVDWLNELIYLHEVNGETYTRFDITELSPTKLVARIHGALTARKMKTFKAATYHDLEIRENTDGAEAHIVFDV